MSRVKHIETRTIPEAWFRVCSEILKNGTTYEVGRGSEETMTRKIAVCLEVSDPEIRPLPHDKAPVPNVEKYALEELFSPDSRVTTTPTGPG